MRGAAAAPRGAARFCYVLHWDPALLSDTRGTNGPSILLSIFTPKPCHSFYTFYLVW